jgi:hypothetical protein
LSDDPWYQPPRTPAQMWPHPAERPARPATSGSAIVFGIFNLLFGVSGLLCVPVGAELQLTPYDKSGKASVIQAIKDVKASSPIYRAGVLILAGLGFVATAVLVVAGAGLLAARDWGRSLSVRYATCSVGLAIVSVVFQSIFFIAPVVSAVPLGDKGYAVGMASVPSIGAILGALYPAALWVAMTQPGIRRALVRKPDIENPWVDLDQI